MKFLFLSDNHYKSYGGRALAAALSHDFEFEFLEDDYGDHLSKLNLGKFDLLVTSAVGGTPGAPHAPLEVESRVRQWLESGVPIVLIHGGSATFWKWAWWRRMVGLRWVRCNDPDNVLPSSHPITAYSLSRASEGDTAEPRLEPMDVPEDELYINLETTRPFRVLLETNFKGQTFPQAYVSSGPNERTVLGYLPGHRSDLAGHPTTVENISRLIRFASASRL